MRTTGASFHCQSGGSSRGSEGLMAMPGQTHLLNGSVEGCAGGCDGSVDSHDGEMCGWSPLLVVSDAQGPAVEVYGSTTGETTTVERNLLLRSVAAATLEIGGGPAVVRNNVVIGGAGAALYVYDYDGRGLVADIDVQSNTVWGESEAAVGLDGWTADAGQSFVNNALGRDDGAGALPDTIAGVVMEGNVDCGDCWADPITGDLWPLADGPLIGAAVVSDPAVTDDWCGQPRPASPTVGALEPGGSGAFDADGDVVCVVATDKSGTQLEEECGCTSAPGLRWGTLLALLAFRRRR